MCFVFVTPAFGRTRSFVWCDVHSCCPEKDVDGWTSNDAGGSHRLRGQTRRFGSWRDVVKVTSVEEGLMSAMLKLWGRSTSRRQMSSFTALCPLPCLSRPAVGEGQFLMCLSRKRLITRKGRCACLPRTRCRYARWSQKAPRSVSWRCTTTTTTITREWFHVHSWGTSMMRRAARRRTLLHTATAVQGDRWRRPGTAISVLPLSLRGQKGIERKLTTHCFLVFPCPRPRPLTLVWPRARLAMECLVPCWHTGSVWANSE